MSNSAEYSETRRLLHHYIGAYGGDLNGDAAAEASERLDQLGFLLDKIRQNERQYLNNRTGNPAADSEEPTRSILKQAAFEVRLYTESFYYLAGRFRTLVRSKAHNFPMLGSFEAEGVRNVRNKLLEHAEGSDSQVYIQSFSLGENGGPALKSYRAGHREDVFPDAGVYVNAEEFKRNLDAALQAAIDSRLS